MPPTLKIGDEFDGDRLCEYTFEIYRKNNNFERLVKFYNVGNDLIKYICLEHIIEFDCAGIESKYSAQVEELCLAAIKNDLVYVREVAISGLAKVSSERGREAVTQLSVYDPKLNIRELAKEYLEDWGWRL